MWNTCYMVIYKISHLEQKVKTQISTAIKGRTEERGTKTYRRPGFIDEPATYWLADGVLLTNGEEMKRITSFLKDRGALYRTIRIKAEFDGDGLVW